MRISDWSSDVCSSDLKPQDTGRCGRIHSTLPGTRTDRTWREAWAHFVADHANQSLRSRRFRSVSKTAARQSGRRSPAPCGGSASRKLSRSSIHRSEEHKSTLQSTMHNSKDVFFLKK